MWWLAGALVWGAGRKETLLSSPPLWCFYPRLGAPSSCAAQLWGFARSTTPAPNRVEPPAFLLRQRSCLHHPRAELLSKRQRSAGVGGAGRQPARAVTRPGPAVGPQRQHWRNFPFCSRAYHGLYSQCGLIQGFLLRRSLIFSSCCWLRSTEELGGILTRAWGRTRCFSSPPG